MNHNYKKIFFYIIVIILTCSAIFFLLGKDNKKEKFNFAEKETKRIIIENKGENVDYRDIRLDYLNEFKRTKSKIVTSFNLGALLESKDGQYIFKDTLEYNSDFYYIQITDEKNYGCKVLSKCFEVTDEGKNFKIYLTYQIYTKNKVIQTGEVFSQHEIINIKEI